MPPQNIRIVEEFLLLRKKILSFHREKNCQHVAQVISGDFQNRGAFVRVCTNYFCGLGKLLALPWIDTEVSQVGLNSKFHFIQFQKAIICVPLKKKDGFFFRNHKPLGVQIISGT